MITSIWTDELVAALTENYPKKGKLWCVENLGLSEAQVRQKASRLGLKARGVSDAWFLARKEHSETLTGRKRPDQAVLIKSMHDQGKLKKTEKQLKALSEQLSNWRKNNEHPKGYLGRKHSKETLAILSERSLAMHKNMSEETKYQKVKKMILTKAERGNMVAPREGTTWKSAWREIGGKRKYFRSRWEANYGRYLEFLKINGQIAEWEHEPETFWFEGIKRGCVSYLPDFRVTKNDNTIEYHEVKGWMDDRSKTKIARMAKYFPDVVLIVVQKKQYDEIKRKLSGVINDWE